MRPTGLRRKLFSRIFGLSVVMTIALFLCACAEVPVTQRKGLHLVPKSELISLSFQQYEEVLKKSKLGYRWFFDSGPKL